MKSKQERVRGAGVSKAFMLTALTGLLAAALYWWPEYKEGYAPALPSLILFINLYALALFDIRSFRLPNVLTATLFIAGAVFAFILPRFGLADHLIGGAVGLVFFPLLNFGYKSLRGRDGIGLGDAKLLAAIGVWLGWQGLPVVLLVASLTGLAVGIIGGASKGGSISQSKIPFGPFLCLGTWIIWLYF